MSLFNEGAEQALVAKLLLDPRQIAVVSGAVQPEDFYVSEYREAYRVMLRLAQDRKPFDIVALQAAGVDIDILDLTLAHHAPLEDYAATIKATAFRRKVVAASDRIARAATDGEENLMAVLQDAFTDVVRGTEQGSLSAPTQAVDDYLMSLEDRMAGDVVGMRYGVPVLDDHLLPAGPGDFAIFAARPSVGKSAMAENVADQWAQAGKGPVLFVSLEMTKDAILDRTLSRHTGIAARKIIQGDLTEEEYNTVREAAGLLKQRDLIFLANGFATSSDVRAAAAKTKMLNDGKLAGIIVDYIQILKDPGDSEVQRVTRISRNLKAIAVENECPVLALSQMSRRIEQENREPELSDLRESGSLEQDADVVVMMTRPLESPILRVYVKKQRQGSVGKFNLHFDGDHSTFTRPAMAPLASMLSPEPEVLAERELGWLASMLSPFVKETPEPEVLAERELGW